jgi:MFS family permease
MIRRIIRFLLGDYLSLPRSVWAVFALQVIMRGGDFVFPFLTLFLTRRLGLSGVAAGFWIMANVASGLAGTLISGKVSDHLGRKRVLAICIAGTGLLTSLCGFLPPSMMIPRVLVLAALFQGSVKPIIAALIMDLCPQHQRKEGFSLSYLGVNLGVAIGPMLAGFLFEKHLVWVFFGNGIALSLSLVLLLLLKLIPAAASAARLMDSEKAIEGSAFRAFLDRPLLVAFCIISLFVSLAYGQTTFGLTLYTAEMFGPRGAANFGFLMSFNAVVVLASTALLTRLTHRLSGPITMAMGSALYAIGFGMLMFRLGMPMLALSTYIWTSGEVMLAINQGAYLAHHTPVNFRGRFQSIREFMSSTGRLLSPGIFGAIITGAGIHISWMITALVALGCAAGFVMLHRWDHPADEAVAEGETP